MVDLPAEEHAAGQRVDGHDIDRELEPHRAAPEEALLSALLVCTHRRFARCSRTLMRRLEGSGVLIEVELDLLAALPRWQDRARFAIPSK